MIFGPILEKPTVRKTAVLFVTLCLAIATASFAATTPAPTKPATTTKSKTTTTHHHHHHHTTKPAPAKKG